MHLFLFIAFLFTTNGCLIAQNPPPKDSLYLVMEELNASARPYWRSDQRAGLKVARQALMLSKEHQIEDQQLLAYKNIGALYLFSAMYDSAYYYWDQGRILADSLGNKRELIKAYSNLAIAAQRSENYQLSIDLNRTSLLEKLALKDTVQIAISYNNIGILYEEMKEYKLAKQNYLQAISLRVELQDTAGLSSTYLNLASLLYTIEQYDSSAFYINRSIEFKKLHDDQWGLANAYTIAGQIETKTGNYQKAKVYYKNALDIANLLDHEILRIEAKI